MKTTLKNVFCTTISLLLINIIHHGVCLAGYDNNKTVYLKDGSSISGIVISEWEMGWDFYSNEKHVSVKKENAVKLTPVWIETEKYPSDAHILYIKNNENIIGNIIEKTDKYILIKNKKGRLQIPTMEIEKAVPISLANQEFDANTLHFDQPQSNEQKEILLTEYKKTIQQKTDTFRKEHPDFVPVDGFKYLKFGLSKTEIDKVLTEEGVKRSQYEEYGRYLVDFLPVFQQTVMTYLTYGKNPSELNEITLGTMEYQAPALEMTGVMFIDTKPKNSVELPSCADGDTLIKGALKKWKNIVLHEKSSVTVAETGTKINIESYVLNYGTVSMMIRKYKIPRHIKSQQRKANGWQTEDMTIISLRYYDFDKGMQFWKQIQAKNARKNKGMPSDASF